MATLNGHLNAHRILSGDLYGGIATGTFNYNELENKPSINGTTLQGDVTISIPTKTSDLTNDSGFITSSDIPTIPTKTSDLTNDSGFITNADIPTLTSELINDSGYITENDIPTNVSAFTNDAGYITSATAPVKSVNGLSGDVTIFVPSDTSQLNNDSGFITANDIPVTSVNTLTGHVVLNGTNVKYNSNTTLNAKIDSVEGSIPTKTSDLNNDSGFITSSDIPVTSVNTLTGDVVLTANDINGLQVNYNDISNAGSSVSIQDGANDTPVGYLNIEIKPIQASGTPTPSDPLPITGTTDVVITVTDSESNQTTTNIAMGQTVYGGNLNVTTGELTITNVIVDLGTITNWVKDTTSLSITVFRSLISDRKPASSSLVCSNYQTFTTGRGALITNNNAIASWNIIDSPIIAIRDDSLSSGTVEDFTTAMSGVQLVYELATPVTLTITPSEIKTFATLCTISVNNNCNIKEMRYYTEGSEFLVNQITKILQGYNLI